jgi:Zn-dependent protease
MQVDFIFSIIVLIISVVIHEVSHGYVADKLGDPTARLAGRLTLNPIKHLDPMGSIFLPLLLGLSSGGRFIFGWAKPVPYNPYNLKNHKWGEAMVATAGPLSNILIALIFGFVIRFGFESLTGPLFNILFIITMVNVVLAVFNLIPIPPLDGSKILFAFLPYRFQNIRFWMEKYQMILVLVVVFFLWRLIFPVVPWIVSLITGLFG